MTRHRQITLTTLTGLLLLIALMAAAPARAAFKPWPQTPLNGSQLAASSKAASDQGVPVNIVRGVATYKYGPSVTTAQINSEATRLAWWYKHLYPKYGGSAIVNWVRATAAEMGKDASPLDVQRAAGNQVSAIATILTGPFWATVAALAPEAAAIGAAAPGETGIGGTAAGTAATGGGAAGDTAAGATAGGTSKAKQLANKVVAGSSNGSADSPANTFRTSAIAASGAVLVGTAAHQLSNASTVDLNAPWFQGLWDRINRYAVVYIGIIAFLAMLMVAMVRANTAMVLDGFLSLATGAMMIATAGTIAMLAMAATDQLCALVGGQDLQHAVTAMHAFAAALVALAAATGAAALTGHAGLVHLLGPPAWFLSIGAFIGAGLLALDLAVRQIGVYLVLLVVPIAAFARVYPGAKEWSTRLFRAMFALIFSKFWIVLSLSVAAALITSGGISGLVYGTLLFLIAAFSPFMIYGLIGHGQHSFHGRQIVPAVAAAAGGKAVMSTISDRRQESPTTRNSSNRIPDTAAQARTRRRTLNHPAPAEAAAAVREHHPAPRTQAAHAAPHTRSHVTTGSTSRAPSTRPAQSSRSSPSPPPTMRDNELPTVTFPEAKRILLYSRDSWDRWYGANTNHSSIWRGSDFLARLKQHGYTLADETFHDNKAGALRPVEQLPDLLRAVQQIEAGEAHAIAVIRQDRLPCCPGHLLDFLQRVWAAGGEVFSFEEGWFEHDKLSILGYQERACGYATERIHAQQRRISGKQRKAAHGGYIGGSKRKYGWQVIPDGNGTGQHVPDQAEQAIIGRVIAARDNGATWQQIADNLNADRVPTVEGAPWSKRTASRLPDRIAQPPRLATVTDVLSPGHVPVEVSSAAGGTMGR